MLTTCAHCNRMTRVRVVKGRVVLCSHRPKRASDPCIGSAGSSFFLRLYTLQEIRSRKRLVRRWVPVQSVDNVESPS